MQLIKNNCTTILDHSLSIQVYTLLPLWGQKINTKNIKIHKLESPQKLRWKGVEVSVTALPPTGSVKHLLPNIYEIRNWQYKLIAA